MKVKMDRPPLTPEQAGPLFKQMLGNAQRSYQRLIDDVLQKHLAPTRVINHEGERYMSVTLGHVYRDVITGIEGMAVSVTTYLTGCDRVCIQPPPRDGKPGDVIFCDDVTLEHVASSRVREVIESNVSASPSRLSGGPRRDPPPR